MDINKELENTLLNSFDLINCNKETIEFKDNISIGENSIKEKTCFSVVSRGGVGKSTFILNEIKTWISQNKKVLYINADDDLSIIKKRLDYDNLKIEEKENLFVISNKTIFELKKEPFNCPTRLYEQKEDFKKDLKETDLLKVIKKLLEDNKINIFIIDTSYLLSPCYSDTDNEVATEFMIKINLLAIELNISIGLIHYTNQSMSLFDYVKVSFTLYNLFDKYFKNMSLSRKINILSNDLIKKYKSVVVCECTKNNYGNKKSLFFYFREDGALESVEKKTVKELKKIKK